VPENVWDTSALAKLYVPERGSQYARQLAATDQIAISSITVVELASALRRRTISGDLTVAQRDAAYRRFLADSRDFSVVEVTDEIRGEAARLLLDDPRVVGRLRGFDAIQLATARLWFEAMRTTNIEPGTFVVADGALRDAALALGVAVDNPEEHE
jgi:hypothetical protein